MKALVKQGLDDKEASEGCLAELMRLIQVLEKETLRR